MQELWAQFEGWLQEHWPEGLADLNPPATDAEIQALEGGLGVALPADFVACLQLHNGQANGVGGLFNGTDFLSSHAVLGEWKIWKELLDGGHFADIKSEPPAGVRDDWWNPRWIPFTYNGCGDHDCIDLDPAAGGQSGQVISMWHDMAERDIQAPSFQAWFADYVQAVLAGEYVYSADYGGLVRAEDLD